MVLAKNYGKKTMEEKTIEKSMERVGQPKAGDWPRSEGWDACPMWCAKRTDPLEVWVGLSVLEITAKPKNY